MICLAIASPTGPLVLEASDNALTGIRWGKPAGCEEGLADPLLQEAARQLAAYFDRRLRAFDLPLDPAGTPFQKRVQDALRRIPFGETSSYGEIARDLGSAARAVGGACRANPIPIVIPCHRVLATAGRMGGFSGGAGPVTKSWLLDLEQARMPSSQPSLFQTAPETHLAKTLAGATRAG